MGIRLFVAVVLLVASEGRAEQVKICDMTVRYRPTGVPSLEVSGVWEGTIDWGIRYRTCHGFVVEGLDDQGQIVVQQAWNGSNSATSDARNAAYIGTAPGRFTKQADGAYTMGQGFTLRLEGNKLVGKFRSRTDNGDHDTVLFKR